MNPNKPDSRTLRERVLIYVIVLALIAGLGYVFWKALRLKNPEATVAEGAVGNMLNQGALLAGSAVDPNGFVIGGAKVTLSAFTGDGHLVWSTTSQTNKHGIFSFSSQEIPAVKDIYPAILTVEAPGSLNGPGYLAEKKNVTVEIDQGKSKDGQTILKVTPNSNQFVLTPYNHWLTLIVLFPAIFGLLFAILHLTSFSLGMRVTSSYAFGTAVLWSAVVAELVGVYVMRGYDLIPLFWPDLFVSSGVVIFAFVGSIVYVAFSMHENKDKLFAESNPDERRKVLITLGGRVLVAPYVALTAYGILAATFPTLRGGASAAFFGFFTGLWIKVVLDMLNDIGIRFLSAENAQKVADRLSRTEVSDAKSTLTSSAAGMKPDQAFLDAVAEARKELLKKENVIGVAAGFKLRSNTSSQADPSILVYVYEKVDLPEDSPDRIPETFRGYATDVTPLPAADPEEMCRGPVFDISWEKLNHDHQKQLDGLDLARSDAIERVEQVLILSDASVFFTINSLNQKEFDVKRAYETVRGRLGDRFDFVAFLMDRKSGIEYIGDYNVQVFNEVKGTNHYLGDNYSQRQAWGTSRLRAAQIHSEEELHLRTLLHEVAHSWCAYATFKDSDASPRSTALLIGGSDQQGVRHWGEAFDDGRSCMDYDRSEWIANSDNTFTKVEIADEDFTYCALDLYMMGLIEASKVGPLRLLQGLEVVDASQQIYKATIKNITIEQVVASCGERVPPASSATFRQAFVVVSNDPESGKEYAKTVNEIRKKHVKSFERATRGLGTLETEIV